MSTVWIILAGVVSVASGAWVYAKCTHAERKAGRDALEAKYREQKRKEDEGRRVNEQALRRKEVIEILDWILRDPEVLRNRNYPSHMLETNAPALYELTKNVKALENLSQRVEFIGSGQSGIRSMMHAITEQQKDIRKALQLGQPVE